MASMVNRLVHVVRKPTFLIRKRALFSSVLTLSKKAAAMDPPPAPSQTTDRVLMITPSAFCFNAQTAVDNQFQRHVEGISPAEVIQKARSEFDGLRGALTSRGIQVNVVDDTVMTSGDAVFPNNWISFHEGSPNKIVLYPMMSELRRTERRADIVQAWKEKLAASEIDLTPYELEGKFLEGTGSLVLDRTNRVAYACKSQRTDADLVAKFCQEFNYSSLELFSALTLKEGVSKPIYHTNVMMSVCVSFAVVCLETIRNKDERLRVVSRLEATNKEIIEISEEQMGKFAGNILQLKNDRDVSFLVMSTCAFESFSADQLALINKHCTGGIIHAPLGTIELLGGGGARCMLAEVFPPLH